MSADTTSVLCADHNPSPIKLSSSLKLSVTFLVRWKFANNSIALILQVGKRCDKASVHNCMVNKQFLRSRHCDQNLVFGGSGENFVEVQRCSNVAHTADILPRHPVHEGRRRDFHKMLERFETLRKLKVLAYIYIRREFFNRHHAVSTSWLITHHSSRFITHQTYSSPFIHQSCFNMCNLSQSSSKLWNFSSLI